MEWIVDSGAGTHIMSKETRDEAGFPFTSKPGMTLMGVGGTVETCLLYTSPSPRDVEESRMPSSA